ncbi:MAG: dihydrofolate reductase family protein [Chloroflexota bacterium]|nr:dihydrofolate reductase family protein [Lentimicrobium sp.]
MSKIIAAINMTLDGYCDHTAIEPDEEVHYHYMGLLNNASAILYGRITYQLMQFWQQLLEKPSGEKSMDDFAIAIDRIQKIVFSNTMKDTGWKSARLSSRSIEDEVAELKKQPGNEVFIGSRSLIIQLMKLNLLDELQLCIHPVIAGKGLPLFENINDSTLLKLVKTKVLNGGAVILYFEP